MNGSYSLLCSPTYPLLPNGKAPNLPGRIQLGSASEIDVGDFSRPPNGSPGCNGPHTTSNGCGGNNVLATVNAGLLLNGSINSKIGGLGKNGYPAGLTSPDARIQRPEQVGCCLPTGCLRGFDDSVFPDIVKELVRIGCDNPLCQEPKWMHPECFRDWQLRQGHPGKLPKRTRHFSDKDVLNMQNLMSWNKRVR